MPEALSSKGSFMELYRGLIYGALGNFTDMEGSFTGALWSFTDLYRAQSELPLMENCVHHSCVAGNYFYYKPLRHVHVVTNGL